MGRAFLRMYQKSKNMFLVLAVFRRKHEHPKPRVSRAERVPLLVRQARQQSRNSKFRALIASVYDASNMNITYVLRVLYKKLRNTSAVNSPDS